MKVKELIAKLQEADPSGELHVSGIYGVERLQGYYDGAGFQVTLSETDESEDKLVISDKEPKIYLYSYGIFDAVERGMPVILDLESDVKRQLYVDEIERCKRLIEEVRTKHPMTRDS